MAELSAQKKLNVIRLFLEGYSYDQIAAKAGVSKGSVSSIVTEFKAEGIIELGDLREHLSLLRDLAVELRRQDTSVTSAVMGLSCMRQFLSLDVEPQELAGFVSMCRNRGDVLEDLSPNEFTRAAVEVHKLSQVKGLDPAAAEARVLELTQTLGALEDRVKDQEAAEERVQTMTVEVRELEEVRTALGGDIGALESKRDSLIGEVGQREIREKELSGRVLELEGRAHTADARLVATRRALKALAAAGLDEADLEGFLQRVVAVAQRHEIPPEDVRHRLVTELENLSVGLGLDKVIVEKDEGIKRLDDEIRDLEKQRDKLNGRIRSLQKEEKRLEGGLEVLQGQARALITKVGSEASAAVAEETKNIQNVLVSFQLDVLQLAGKAARLDAGLNTNRWMTKILTLFDEKGDLTPSDVKIIVLLLLTAIQSWLGRHSELYLPMAGLSLESLIKFFQDWQA